MLIPLWFWALGAAWVRSAKMRDRGNKGINTYNRLPVPLGEIDRSVVVHWRLQLRSRRHFLCGPEDLAFVWRHRWALNAHTGQVCRKVVVASKDGSKRKRLAGADRDGTITSVDGGCAYADPPTIGSVLETSESAPVHQPMIAERADCIELRPRKFVLRVNSYLERGKWNLNVFAEQQTFCWVLG